MAIANSIKQRLPLRRWSWTVPFALTVLTYLPTLDAELVWDDEIVQQRQLVAFQSISDIFFPPQGIQEWSRSYYRPLVIVSYLFDRWLYGSERFHGHHLSNVLIHAVASVCVLLLTRRALAAHRFGEWGALLSGAVFALHPIHVESISPLMGRSDTLATALLLMSILLALHGRDHPRRLWAVPLSALFFLAAVLSKEVALAGLLLVPLMWMLVPSPMSGSGGVSSPSSVATRRNSRERPPRREAARCPLRFPVSVRFLGLCGLLLVGTATYFTLRQAAGCTSGGSTLHDSPTALGQCVRAVAYYLIKAVVPPPQSAFVTASELPPSLLGVAAILLVAGTGLLGWHRRRGGVAPLIAWTWFIVALAPSMAVAVSKVSEQPVAERYLYLPSVAVALLMGGLLEHGLARGWMRTCVIGALAISLFYAGQSVSRMSVWHDNLAFWRDSVAKAPSQGLPAYQLGLSYARLGRADEALGWYQRGLRLYDDAEGRSLAQNSIGTVHLQRGDLEAAEASFLASIRERPDYRTPYYNLGVLCATRAEARWQKTRRLDIPLLEQAREYLSQAVRLSPSYLKAQYLLATQTLILADAQRAAGDVKQSDALLDDCRDRATWLAAYDAAGDYGHRAAELVQVIDTRRRSGQMSP